MKMHLKISCAKWRPYCPGGDELKKVHMASGPSNERQDGRLFGADSLPELMLTFCLMDL